MVYWIREVLELVNVPDRYIDATQTAFTLIAVLLPLPILIGFYRWARPRQALVPPYKERVLILGATSGVGKEIALAYAHRGCRNIALVGRRQKELDQAVSECIERKKEGEEWEMSQEAPGWEEQPGQTDETRARGGILALQGDCTNAEDLIRIREDCRGAFGGIDTIHVCYGVSALRPLLGIAGIDPVRKIKRADLLPNLSTQKNKIEADVDTIRVVQEAHRRINDINVISTSMLLATFLPMLQTTSPAPSINLLSSASAYFPAPTRSLYGSSQAAQLILFQAVGIEAAAQAQARTVPSRAKVYFHATVPATILSDFRNSAVDGSVESSGAKDDTWSHKSGGQGGGGSKGDGLTTSHVAERCIFAVDRFKTGVEEMPSKYYFARRVYPFFPSLIDKLARKKYSY